ncbi:MAG: imidazolonepropionase [Actinobacteria bacterium]|nr:imidazolonepropionase [Actinomycetota bacterium]
MADLLVRRAGAVFGHSTTGPTAIVIRNGRVAAVLPDRDVPSGPLIPELDAGGRVVLPGFVDSHAHLVFAGDRRAEFAARLAGQPYEAGGIMQTVEATRAASLDDLVAGVVERATACLLDGTTTVEAKSGYALDVEGERRSLEALHLAGARVPVDIVPTFLGAHLAPYDGYVDEVVHDMLPACAPLARFCDAFCDEGALSVDDARRVLRAGCSYGLLPRLHAEELAHSGGARLAAELRCASADHLVHADDADIAALAAAGVVAVLLPATSHCVGIGYAPARRFLDAGAVVALATDCNPGTSYTTSMPFVIGLACIEYGLTVDEAIRAATWGGAQSLRLDDIGQLHVGARGDLVVLDTDDWVDLAYRPGSHLVADVVKDGVHVVCEGRLR